MSSFLQEKEGVRTKHKNKILFLPVPNPDKWLLFIIVIVLYILLLLFILSFLWPLLVGAIGTYLILKFVKEQKIKIISVSLVVLMSLLGVYMWNNKANHDSETHKAQQAIESSLKAEQKQKDKAEKTKQDAINQEVKAKQATADQLAKAQADAKAKEQIISELTPICITNHKSLFKPKIQELLDGTEVTPQSVTKKGAYSSNECTQIVTGLYDKGYKKEEIQKVAEAKYWVGMEAKLLIFSVGIANNYSSSTTTIFGTSSQLVYGDPLYGADYIYVDNGKVTSFQN